MIWSISAGQILIFLFIGILFFCNGYQYFILLSQITSLTKLEAKFDHEFSQIKLENKKQTQEITLLQSEIQQYRNDLNVTNGKLEKITTTTSTEMMKSIFSEDKGNNFHPNRKSKRPARLLPLSILRGKKLNITINKNILPTSCNDLNDYGHTLNGIYLIAGNKIKNTRYIDVVFCDFQPLEIMSNQMAGSQLNTGEKRLGYLDVNKSASSVYFYVARLGKLPSYKDGTVRFDKEHLNIGGGFNMSTGVFKAPKAGIYHFSFSCLKDGYSFESFYIYLRVNDVSTAVSAVGAGLGIAPATLQIMQKLKKGDRVSLFKLNGAFGTDTYTPSHHFTGLLLEEDLEE